MPLPATTGSLKQKISDLQIGDYIAIKYVAGTSGALGTFSNLGADLATAQANEIPVAGSATPNGYLYLVKCAKGLLVSSSVAQSSISFDVLNTGKVIQGLPWDNGNIIPTMTSNTTPSGVASASSVYATGFEAWRAFDGSLSNSNLWGSSVESSPWICYDFGSQKTIRRYTIFSNAGIDRTIDPKSWVFEGSNDGISWIKLDERNNMTFAQSEGKSFLLNSVGNYSKYRIRMTALNSSGRVSIGDINMMDTAGIIRSLTGGVAYADANGNKNTSGSGTIIGSWPTNNEWDKFITNFPLNLIQSGKTLDDVFHHSTPAVYTWVQETPTVEMYANNYRVRRIPGFNVLTSNTSASNTGFRPVFEYKE